MGPSVVHAVAVSVTAAEHEESDDVDDEADHADDHHQFRIVYRFRFQKALNETKVVLLSRLYDITLSYIMSLIMSYV